MLSVYVIKNKDGDIKRRLNSKKNVITPTSNRDHHLQFLKNS